MPLENGKIASSEFVHLLIGFTIGSSALLPPGGLAKHDNWIAILIGLGEGLLFALVYSTLAARFRNKTLVEISDMVYGPWLSKLVSVAFLWFLFHLGSLVLGNFSNFFAMAVMPETPGVVFALLTALICASAARNGVEVIARCSQVLVFPVILIFLVDVLLLLREFDARNLQPVLEAPLGKLLWAAHGAATFPFAETVAFLMVIPFMNDSREAPRSAAKGLVIAGLTLAMIALRNSGVLGITADKAVYPSFTATRLINIAHFLTRVEIIVSIVLMSMGFLKISVLFYGVVLGAAQVLNLRSYRPLVWPVCILMTILSLINFRNVTENIEFVEISWPLYALPFEFGIPLLTLLVACIRKLPREES